MVKKLDLNELERKTGNTYEVIELDGKFCLVFGFTDNDDEIQTVFGAKFYDMETLQQIVNDIAKDVN